MFPKNCAIMVGTYVLWECIPCSRSGVRKGALAKLIIVGYAVAALNSLMMMLILNGVEIFLKFAYK